MDRHFVKARLFLLRKEIGAQGVAKPVPPGGIIPAPLDNNDRQVDKDESLLTDLFEGKLNTDCVTLFESAKPKLNSDLKNLDSEIVREYFS